MSDAENQRLMRANADLKRLELLAREREEELEREKFETQKLLEKITLAEQSARQDKAMELKMKDTNRKQKTRIKKLERQIEAARKGYKEELFSVDQQNKAFLDSLEEELKKVNLEVMSVGDLQRMTGIFMEQMQKVTEQTVSSSTFPH